MQIPGYIKAVFISLLIIIIVFVLIIAKTILIPLMLSGFIAMLLTSFCNWLEKRKIPRSLSAAIALLLATVILGGFLYFVVSQLSHFSEDLKGGLAEKVNVFAQKIDTYLQNSTGIDMGMDNGLDVTRLLSLVQKGEDEFAVFLVAIGTISDIFLLPIFVFFLLIYRDHFAVFITKVFKKQKDSELMNHLVSIRHIVYSYLTGAGKVMVILGIVNTGVLFALGIKHAIFFGMFAGFLNIIPYLGPTLGAVLPFLYALVTKDSLFYPFAVVASFTLIQLLESAYLTPRITGANVHLNAFVTFFGLLVGGAIWGIPGMILIIPSIAILKKLFELSPDTEPYAYLFGEEHPQWFKKKH